MEMKTGSAATRAKNKFNEKAYDRLYPFVKKGKKELYLLAAKKAGISLNELVEKAVDEKTAEILGNK